MNRRLLSIGILSAALWVMALLMLLPGAQAQTLVQQYTVDFRAAGTERLTPAARQAIVDAANRWTGQPPTNGTFYLIGMDWGSDWAIGTLSLADLDAELDSAPATSLDDIEDTKLTPQNMIALLVVETPAGWQVALDNELTVQHLLDYVPDSELSRAAKAAIFPANVNLLRPSVLQTEQQYDNYKLPWPGGLPWARTRSGLGWHDGTWGGRFPTNNSLDFDIINRANSSILASADGIVTHICQVAGEQQAGIVVKTLGTDESLGYLHLQSSSIPAGITIGATVRQGNSLGEMVEGTISGTCGYSIGTHLHVYFPTRPFTMDGYTFSSTDTQGGVDLYSSQPVLGTLTPAPENQNVVRNGSFEDGFDDWTTQLEATQEIQGDGYGDYVAWRGTSGEAGVIAQMLNYAAPKDSVLEMALDLGNASSAQKQIRVHLHPHDGSAIWDDMLVCDFTLPANTPLQTYTLSKQITTHWENMRVWIESWPADNLPSVLTDNVTVRRYTTLDAPSGSTQCLEPINQRTWSFEGTNGPQGWTIANASLINPRQLASGMWYTVAGNGPALHSPALEGINAADYRYLMVEMASLTDTCGRVYFQQSGQRGFSESQAVEFQIQPIGAPQTYYIEMGSNPNWNGQISRLRLDPACDSGYDASNGNVIALVRVMLTNVDPNLQLSAPAGTINSSTGNPLYTWPHLPEADRYEIYVARENALATALVYQPVPAATYCDSATCAFDPTTISASHWLANGEYVIYLRMHTQSGWSDWVGGFEFTLNTPPAAVPTIEMPDNLTGTGFSSRPTFTWRTDDPNTAWFNLKIAPRDEPNAPLVNTWVVRRDACGDDSCNYQVTTDLVDGDYLIYLQSWGPGGVSQQVGPVAYTLDNPAPGTLTQVTANPPALSWRHDPNAAWYQVWVGTLEPVEPLHYEWHFGGDLGCAEMCTFTLPEPGNAGTVYSWYVQAWGSGGLGGWTAGPTFTIR